MVSPGVVLDEDRAGHGDALREGDGVAVPTPPAEETELIETATPEKPDDPEALPVLGYSGIGVGVLGGGLILGGAILALAQDGVLVDPKSTRDEKDLALALVPTGLVIAGVGVLALSAGGGLATLGFAGK